MAVETKIFLSKKKKTIMSEYRSPLVEPEPVPEPVKVTESPGPEKVDEVKPEISKSAHSVEIRLSVKQSDSSESDEEFSDCESEDEIQTDPRFFHSSVPCTHQVRVQDFEISTMKTGLFNEFFREIYLKIECPKSFSGTLYLAQSSETPTSMGVYRFPTWVVAISAPLVTLSTPALSDFEQRLWSDSYPAGSASCDLSRKNSNFQYVLQTD